MDNTQYTKKELEDKIDELAIAIKDKTYELPLDAKDKEFLDTSLKTISFKAMQAGLVLKVNEDFGSPIEKKGELTQRWFNDKPMSKTAESILNMWALYSTEYLGQGVASADDYMNVMTKVAPIVRKIQEDQNQLRELADLYQKMLVKEAEEQYRLEHPEEDVMMLNAVDEESPEDNPQQEDF